MFQDGRYLIINADDFGMCHATNQAISTLLSEGAITSASLMMPCPWVNEAIQYWKQHPQADVGIHITHTSEWDQYKWRPLIGDLQSLVDEKGFFTHDAFKLWDTADANQLRKEAVAQMELAYSLGLDPTNIDNHMGSLNKHMDILLDLCEQYDLPLRYPRQVEGFWRDLADHEYILAEADKRGIMLVDYMGMLPFFAPEGEEPKYEQTKQAAIEVIKGLKPGITELVMHPSLATDELKAITTTYAIRQADFDVFRDPEIQKLMKTEDVRLLHWRDVRDYQRSNKI